MEEKIIKVLLIEDSSLDIRLIQDMFNEIGASFNLEVAEQFSSGMVCLDRESFDLVLLDLVLPDSLGLETFVSIHTHIPHVPTIILTGLDDEEMAIAAVREGAQDYLVKGQVTHKLLEHAMRYAIERRQVEQHRLELAVEKEKVKLLQRFLSDVSHDLRVPLSAIKTSIFVLQELADSEKQRRHLEIVKIQATHLEKLGEDMSTMSRLEATAEFEFEPVNLNALIQDILVGQETKAIGNNQTVTFIPGTDIPSVMADKTYLNRAIANIIINALSYTPEGGTITTRTYERGQQVVVEVQDTGIGIDTEDLPYIFERFYRADEVRNTHKSGTGLGLAIAQKIATLHRGNIEVESEPNQGSTFKILLPTENK